MIPNNRLHKRLMDTGRREGGNNTGGLASWSLVEWEVLENLPLLTDRCSCVLSWNPRPHPVRCSRLWDLLRKRSSGKTCKRGREPGQGRGKSWGRTKSQPEPREGIPLSPRFDFTPRRLFTRTVTPASPQLHKRHWVLSMDQVLEVNSASALTSLQWSSVHQGKHVYLLLHSFCCHWTISVPCTGKWVISSQLVSALGNASLRTHFKPSFLTVLK